MHQSTNHLTHSLSACRGSFPSGRGETAPNPKSGWDLHPDKLVCSTFCQKDVTDPSFLPPFVCFFVPYSTTFATDPRVVEWVTGSVPVELPHYVTC